MTTAEDSAMHVTDAAPPTKRFANGKWYPIKGTDLWEAYRGGKRYEGTLAATMIHLDHQERRAHYDHLVRSGRLASFQRDRLKGRAFPKPWIGCAFCEARPR